MKNYRKILSVIAYNEAGTIRSAVANEALRYDNDDIPNFFRDLLNHGCVSGMVGSLIYYNQTHRFFKNHYYEILEILDELRDQGIAWKYSGSDLMNELAWLSFEQVAYRMFDELGLD